MSDERNTQSSMPRH